MCECVDKLNEQLKEHNTRIVIPIMLNKKTLDFASANTLVVTEKVDSAKRGKPLKVSASYCPFCGKKYEQEK